MATTSPPAEAVSPPAGETESPPVTGDPDHSNGVTRSEKKSLRLMVGLSAGHGIKHFGQGALLVMSPSIRETLALSEVALGGIFTAQSIASGVANVPAGILTDMYRRKVAWLLTASMMLVAFGYLMIGLSPWYWMVVMSVTVIGFGTSMWHAPAFGTLAANYPERRGLAMSAHLTGAQVGNTIAPVVIGVLLGGVVIGAATWDGLHWRTISYLLFIPSALTALAVITMVKTAGQEATRNLRMGEYLASASRLVRNTGVLGMVLLGAFRGAVHNSFLVFLVLHLSETLNYSAFIIGVHISLVTLAGIASTPVMGVVSDRVGRRPVIFTAMSLMTALIFLFLRFDTGAPLTVLLGFLGLFFFSVMPIITAAAMDQVDRGSEGSATALMFAGGSVIGALSPIAAGVIYSQWGFAGVVWFSGSLAATGAALAAFLPMDRRDAPVRGETAQ